MKTDNLPARIRDYPPSITRSVLCAMELISADVSNHIVLKNLARNAGTNECTLKRGFKDIFRTTIYQYLLQSRMKYAAHLLQATDWREKDIARLCGYESLSAFITTFRKHSAVSPGEFRTQAGMKLLPDQPSVYQ